ncbi:peptide deformylase 4 [Nocardioides baekrokdamisoli]|uniref:Peptide deformylase n=1 Tax=Nocardioides baekrokdamisoli TaxID=1804624 RepID=A0A3G9IAY5_9ACTN|nr:peptide deformylase [Nocardioides baekrokdamisoli]BBH15920.1 peptide deformylase 4 [Nocardioides baekrokdamisoli]
MTESPIAPYGSLPAGGTVRPITRWGEPVMGRTLVRVTEFGDGLMSLVADMVATMYAAEGVGLAANQIGADSAVFVFDCPDETGRHTVGVVCNPVLELPVGAERRLDNDDEGCLSWPGAYVPCARPDFAAVTGQGLSGEPVRFEGSGLLARCLQHETDHLNGIVFGDRISLKARKKLDKQMQKAAPDYPLTWPVP